MCSMPVPSLLQVHPMRLGLWAINFGACADPDLQVRAAVAAEESGFESIWASEHVAMPIRDNPVDREPRQRGRSYQPAPPRDRHPRHAAPQPGPSRQGARNARPGLRWTPDRGLRRRLCRGGVPGARRCLQGARCDHRRVPAGDPRALDRGGAAFRRPVRTSRTPPSRRRTRTPRRASASS